MIVFLTHSWFAPDATLYSKLDNPHEFPDEWKGMLPSTAQVEEEEVAPKGKPKVDL